MYKEGDVEVNEEPNLRNWIHSMIKFDYKNEVRNADGTFR